MTAPRHAPSVSRPTSKPCRPRRSEKDTWIGSSFPVRKGFAWCRGSRRRGPGARDAANFRNVGRTAELARSWSPSAMRAQGNNDEGTSMSTQRSARIHRRTRLPAARRRRESARQRRFEGVRYEGSNDDAHLDGAFVQGVRRAAAGARRATGTEDRRDLNLTLAAAARPSRPHRCFISLSRSRAQSRSFSASRLSCCFLPLARPSSTLARPRFQYIDSAITL